MVSNVLLMVILVKTTKFDKKHHSKDSIFTNPTKVGTNGIYYILTISIIGFEYTNPLLRLPNFDFSFNFNKL